MTVEERQQARARHRRLQNRADNYVSWANAGGPNECGHGYAAGIPCFECDELHAREDLPRALDDLDVKDARIAELSAEVERLREALGNSGGWFPGGLG